MLLAGTGLTTLACLGAPSAARPPAPSTGYDPATLFLPPSSPPRGLPRTDHSPLPGWLADAGAWFCPSPRSAGSVLLTFAGIGQYTLPRRLTHFRELPTLLDRARALGTDVLYLVDWYEGAPGAKPIDAVWNKGDYRPRADLGGPDALKAGIAAVRVRGGRVISYLEPYVIAKTSNVAKKHGADWALETRDGAAEAQYPDDLELCPSAPGMAEYVVATARRLVGELGFDGLFLDSYGYQHGRRCVADHGHPKGDAEVFDAGAEALVKRVASAVRAQRPDGALLVEGPRLARLFQHVHGCQDWHPGAVLDRWVGDRAGHLAVFTAGWSLDDLHQALAAGHRLSLGGGFWHEAPLAPSPAAWFAEHFPDPVPDRPSARFRRYWIERYARRLHTWRNAAILAGLPVPSVDRACPRRWDRAEDFESHAGMKRIAGDIRDAARALDGALADHEGPLPAATEHVQRIVRARAAFQPVVAGSTVTLAHRGSASAGWRFEGPGGVGFGVVNVGNEPLSVELSAPAGRYVDRVGEGNATSKGTLAVEVPAHGLGLWAPTPASD